MNDISNAQTTIGASVQNLRERFIDRAYHQAQELDHLLGQLEADPSDQAARASVTSIVHKISGVAKTLGFERLGILAHEAECDLIAQGNQTTADTTVIAFEKVEVLIEELDSVIAS